MKNFTRFGIGFRLSEALSGHAGRIGVGLCCRTAQSVLHDRRGCGILLPDYAGMAELADALDLGSSAARHAGSTPVTRTTPAVSKTRTAGFSLSKRLVRAGTDLFRPVFSLCARFAVVECSTSLDAEEKPAKVSPPPLRFLASIYKLI